MTWLPPEAESLLGGAVGLLPGDCLERLAALPEASVDAVVTDPPYHLTSIVKRFGGSSAAPSASSGAYLRSAKGFMGQTWDGGDLAFRPETWAAIARVLKPGGHVLAFGGTRGFARLFVAMEDAGLESRDLILWLYGSGFPKSHNVGRLVAEWEGWGTALKPAVEPIALMRKPLSAGSVARQCVETGTGALNIDACRYGQAAATTHGSGGRVFGDGKGLWAPGKRTAFRPHEAGRWPANVITDGSDEVAQAFAAFAAGGDNPMRFFYSAKADDADRAGSGHPTIKPLALMQWLIRLVTRRGGLVLDPFGGSGTTGEAAWREGCRALLVERDGGYCEDIRRRMALAAAGPVERAAARGRGAAAPAGPLFGDGEP